MDTNRKVVLFISVSIDGYLARKNGDIDWLSIVEDPKEDYGYKEFVKSIDAVIMGRNTYEKVRSFGIEFPHRDKKCYVLSRSKKSSDQYVEFYEGNVRDLISKIRLHEGLNIFLDGGAQVVHEFILQDLIDEYIISIVPILLGNGIPLFGGDKPEVKLKLHGCKEFSSGLIQLSYSRSIQNR